jgi:predicted dienelactone hydrolase
MGLPILRTVVALAISSWWMQPAPQATPAAGQEGDERGKPPQTAPPEAGGAAAPGRRYDPLALDPDLVPATSDHEIVDPHRSRAIPIRVWLPTAATPSPAAAPVPVLLFSHGLGGNRETPRYLPSHWAARGYAVVALQHAGSDDAVWKQAPLLRRRSRLVQAASAENFLLRARDVTAVIDQLETWNSTPGHELAGRLDLSRVGMSGHSFGAVTTQAVSGQRMLLGAGLTDLRIKAAVILSPSAPTVELAPRAFGEVALPWLLMTGTADDSPIGDVDAAARLAVFDALPEAGNKYQLVLDQAVHMTFGDRVVSGEAAQILAAHHRAILAISTAFWDAWLRGDQPARAWLDGDGAVDVLTTKDRWERK